MTDALNDLYENHILYHFEEPYHKGHLDTATHCHTVRIPTCGDQVELQLLIDSNRIQQAWFDAKGCVISQAAASIFCQHIEGKTIDEITTMQPRQMLDLLKVPLTATRQQCGLLPFIGVQQIMENVQ